MVVGVVLLLAAGAAAYGGWRWTQTQFYVGDADGRVAIYRGVPQTLGPLHLSTVESSTDIAVGELPQMWRSALDGEMRMADLGAAESKVGELRRVAQACRLDRASAGCGGAP